MTLQEYVDNIKLELTGGVLELEIDDETIGKFVMQALREIQRYIDETKLVQVPFSSCIDLGEYVDEQGEKHEFKHSSITNVYRCEAVGDQGKGNGGISSVDPAYAQFWLASSNGSSMYNLNSWLMNYMTYNTLLQLRNTTSTDLAFREDKHQNKLYINVSAGRPDYIAIEYVPIFEKVDDIKSDYWKEILYRLALAITKMGLGRIRTWAKQNNALYTVDGDTILEEGRSERTEIEQRLIQNSNLFYPVD